MKYFLCGLIIGLVSHVVLSAQYPDDLDINPIPMLYVTDVNGMNVIFTDEAAAPPSNSTLFATLEAQCLTGGKNCKVPLKVWKIQ